MREKLTSLFFLFLISVLFVPSCISEDVETTEPTSINFKPGSWIPTIWTWEIVNLIPGKSPDRLRIELFAPDGSKKWMIDGETDYKQDLGYGHWLVKVYDKDLFVPAFPMTGAWRVKFIFYNEIWIADSYCAIMPLSFNVVEGGIIENLMAPNYIFIEGPLGWGVLPTIKIPLPGWFWILSPIWVIGGIILAVRLWKAGVGGGMEKLARGKKMKKNRIGRWFKKADDAFVVTGMLVVALLVVILGFIAMMVIISNIINIAIGIGIIAVAMLAVAFAITMVKKAFAKGGTT